MEKNSSASLLAERCFNYHFYSVKIEVVSSGNDQKVNDNKEGKELDSNSRDNTALNVSKCDKTNIVSDSTSGQPEAESNEQHKDHTYSQPESTEGEHSVNKVFRSKSRVVLNHVKGETTKYVAYESQLDSFTITSLKQCRNANEQNKPKVRRKAFLCSKCPQMGISLAEILRHEKTHNTERRFQCPLCGVFLKSKGVLNGHIARHINGKCYHCPHCSASFTLKRSLVGHIRYLHTGEMPYTCEVCSKSFHMKNGLERHTRIHSVTAKYHCPICNKGFAQTSNLKGHIRTHTNEKPFVCDICGKGFNFNHACKSHRLVCEKNNC